MWCHIMEMKKTYICESRKDLQLLQMSAKKHIRQGTDICGVKSVNTVANNSNSISDISPIQPNALQKAQ